MENIKNKCNCNCSKEKKVVNTYKAKANKYVSTATNKLKFEFIENFEAIIKAKLILIMVMVIHLIIIYIID